MARVLIVGGGFGGVRAALHARKILPADTEITVVDKNAAQLFTPSLYEIASVFDIPADRFHQSLRRAILLPYADIFKGKQINFVQAEVKKIDFDTKIAFTNSDHQLAYDFLIIGVGSRVSDFGVSGVQDYAYQFKTFEDALRVNQTVLELMANAIRTGRNQPLKFLIVGAGFTGIELAGELALFCRKLAHKLGIARKMAIFYLFEGAPKILPNVSDKERLLIRRRLTKLGVVVMENSRIESAMSKTLKLKNSHTIEGDVVIWTAGVEPNACLKTMGPLPINDQGKIPVDEYLRVPELAHTFAVGDIIEFIDEQTQRPVPGLAYTAADQGQVAAENIRNLLKQKPLKEYKPFYDAWIAPVGGKYAVAHLGQGITVPGFVGWFIREMVDLRYFLSVLPFRKALIYFWRGFRIFIRND
ncbi:MAG: NAD(P)/FAD-dependent oxidoreductase [Candidatus Yanofskybacteria bacterium]|nr:NAD(P)/FAD-dependent oxidoreductase [Candidatus Yanofskybacteria bacterium]